MDSFSFESINDIIETAQKYIRSRVRTRSNPNVAPYNHDLNNLVVCIEPLKKLNRLVGMETVKKNIIDQVLFYAQELNSNEMMHVCLNGPPGVGKTTLGKILAELYCSMGFLDSEAFTVVTSADLIAGYIGQTAIKTRKVLKASIGGVLFLDEAYSIGSGDSDQVGFSKECADTINAFLSENTSNFIMIIAGYRDELDKCFFSLNKGLKRRFPWVYEIDKYTPKNLKDIFVYQVNENGWELEIEDTVLEKFFETNISFFEHNGGDTLILFDKSKIVHSRRMFGKKRKFKMTLLLEDITNALELIKVLKKRPKNDPPYGMYV